MIHIFKNSKGEYTFIKCMESIESFCDVHKLHKGYNITNFRITGYYKSHLNRKDTSEYYLCINMTHHKIEYLSIYDVLIDAIRKYNIQNILQ